MTSAWIEDAAGRLAAIVGEPIEAYGLSDAEVEELLELARVAAHESGERVNAPLLCYLVGLARGRHPERGLLELGESASAAS